MRRQLQVCRDGRGVQVRLCREEEEPQLLQGLHCHVTRSMV